MFLKCLRAWGALRIRNCSQWGWGAASQLEAFSDSKVHGTDRETETSWSQLACCAPCVCPTTGLLRQASPMADYSFSSAVSKPCSLRFYSFCCCCCCCFRSFSVCECARVRAHSLSYFIFGIFKLFCCLFAY